MAQADVLRHRPRAPVRSATRRGFERLGHHRLHSIVGNRARYTRPRLVVQPIQAFGDEPRPPLADGAAAHAKLACDVLVRLRSFGTTQDDLGAKGHLTTEERAIPRLD